MKKLLIEYIPSILSISSALLNVVLTWRLNLFSKYKEIKFGNYHKSQVDKISEFYKYLYDMHNATRILFSSNNDNWSLVILKNKVIKWDKEFVECYFYYHRNRIFFPNEIKKKLNEYFEELRQIRVLILEQKDLINEEEVYNNHYFSSPEDEIQHIKEILNQLRHKPEFKNLFSESLLIIDEIEKTFGKLLK